MKKRKYTSLWLTLAVLAIWVYIEVEPVLSQNGGLNQQQLEGLLDKMGGTGWFGPEQGQGAPGGQIRQDQMQMQMPGAGYSQQAMPRSGMPMTMPSQPANFGGQMQGPMPMGQMPMGQMPMQAPMNMPNQQRPGLFGRIFGQQAPQQNQQQQNQGQGWFGNGQPNAGQQEAAQNALSAVQYELSVASSNASQAQAYMSDALSTQDRSAKSSAASEARYYANEARAAASRARSRASGYPEAMSLVGAVQAAADRAQSAADSASSGW
ncbi:MAG: hypothetical protein AB7W16_29375 [Candidatus Obscuribacterales bacterium]